MARTISQIKQQLIDAKNADANLSGLNSPSQTAIWNLWLFLQAVVINIFEQLQDIFKMEIEAIALFSAPSTELWIQDKVKNLFQYDASVPQVVEFINFYPTYAAIDITKRIVKLCSVITNSNKTVNIKVAKATDDSSPLSESNPPIQLDSLQQLTVTSFLNAIRPAGIQINVVNLASDKIKIAAQIFYDGQYSSVIQTNVIAALNTFLFNIPFDGVVKVSDIEKTILSVTGVKDVILNTVRTRDDATLPANGTLLVDSNTVIFRSWATIAGYIIAETNTGETFEDTLSFIIA